MAKKARKDGIRIPKEIGGIKIPKELRKRGEALIDQANSPAGRQAIASVMMGAATMATAAMAKKAAEKSAEPATPTGEAKEEPKQGTQAAPDIHALVDTIGTAAEAMIGRFFAKRA